MIIVCLPLYLLRFKIWQIPFTALELAIYILFVFWLREKIKSRKISWPDKQFIAPIFFIFIGAAISSLFSSDLRVSAGIYKGWFLDPLIFFIIFIDNVKSHHQIKKTFLALMLSGLVISIISFWYFLRHDMTFDHRLQAIYLSPNHLAMYLSPIFVLSFYFYALIKKNIYKVSLFLFQVFCLAIIYLTYSYSSWLGLGAGLAFFFVLSFKKLGFAKYIILIFILAVIFFMIWQIPSEKFQAFLHQYRSSWHSRLMVWQAAWLIIKDHPLIGIGPGMFQKYYLDYQIYFEPYLEWAITQPHNIFLAFWLQTGLLGLMGFIWLIIVFFKAIFKNLSLLAIALAAAMAYTLVHGMLDALYWKNDLSVFFWLIIGLAIANLRLAKRLER